MRKWGVICMVQVSVVTALVPPPPSHRFRLGYRVDFAGIIFGTIRYYKRNFYLFCEKDTASTLCTFG